MFGYLDSQGTDSFNNSLQKNHNAQTLPQPRPTLQQLTVIANQEQPYQESRKTPLKRPVSRLPPSFRSINIATIKEYRSSSPNPKGGCLIIYLGQLEKIKTNPCALSCTPKEPWLRGVVIRANQTQVDRNGRTATVPYT